MADHPYSVDKRLIVLPVKIFSPTRFLEANFILDTGASYTIIDHRLAGSLGYTRDNAVSSSRVSSAIGKEEGYRVRIEAIEALGEKFEAFEIACHSLFEQGVAGLLGMTFLERFDFCIFPSKQIIRIT